MMIFRCTLVMVFAGLIAPLNAAAAAVIAESGLVEASVLVAAKRKRKRRRRRKKSVKKVIAKPLEKPLVEAKEEPPPVPEQPTEPEDPRPGVAVLDLEVIEGVSAGVGKMLNQVMMQRLTASKRFSSLLGMGDIREMLDMEAQKAALGCEQESCLAEIGGALGVPLLVVPSLGKLADVYLLTLKINDVENATVSVRLSRELNGEGELLEAMKAMVDEALFRHFDPAGFEAAEAAKIAAAAEAVKRAQANGRRAVLARNVGLGLIGLGAGAAGFGHFGIYSPALSTFEGQPSEANLADLDAAVSQANLAMMAGVGLALTGGVSWWLLD
ncbi:MAG: hypothetical protein OSB21_09205 [Myxococcota bacterium]|nr:hypothetical protein [Myxococcota bacterium]